MMKKNMSKKVCSVFLTTAMVVSMLTACGSKNTDTAEAASKDGVTVVKVGTGNGAAPFCYLDDNGEPIGYDLDVLHEMDKRLEQYEFDIQAMDFSTLIVSIDSGAIDMISHQLVKSEARKEKYLFPDEYYCLSPMSLAVKKDSGITGMKDMAGKTVEQNPSAYEYQMLLAYNEAHPDSEIVINAVSDQTQADNYKKVSNGQIDASLTYKSTYDSVISEIGIDNMMLTDVVMCEDTYMMFGKDDEALCKAISEVTAEMKADGTMSEISNKWYGEDVFTKYADMVTIVAE